MVQNLYTLDKEKTMNTIDAIMKRKSIRKFTEQEISKEDIHTILKAGMAGPTAVNKRDWKFIAVTDKEVLAKMAEGNGRAADPLKGAALGILVCGDMEKAFERARDFWVVDCSIACQNMILAAEDLGIGSVWLGTWPNGAKMYAQKRNFDLPVNIYPHSIIAFGYPAEDPDRSAKPEFEEDKVIYY